jgi:hypothetical protein
MTPAEQLPVLLQPGGRAVPLAAVTDPAAHWHVLGQTRDGSVPSSFVRAEIAGGCWVALVPTVWLAQPGTVVSLTRQTLPEPALLTGWAHFC